MYMWFLNQITTKMNLSVFYKEMLLNLATQRIFNSSHMRSKCLLRAKGDISPLKGSLMLDIN